MREISPRKSYTYAILRNSLVPISLDRKNGRFVLSESTKRPGRRAEGAQKATAIPCP